MTGAMKALNPPILREPIEAQEWSAPTQTHKKTTAPRPVASLTAPLKTPQRSIQANLVGRGYGGGGSGGARVAVGVGSLLGE